jgi:NADPH:quinone reductase-like Zn-dependent oxidoreductase
MASGNNVAAYITHAKAHPFEVGSAPVWAPGENEILVKNQAVAINPVDGNLQYTAFFPLKYPTVLGQDVAGEVVAIGPGVTRFEVGDRVIGHATSMISGRQQDGGFQRYTTLQTNLVSPIPAKMAYETAVVLPLGLSTASAGLFQKNFLNLQLPQEPAREPTGKTLLIWGGASSVGSNASKHILIPWRLVSRLTLLVRDSSASHCRRLRGHHHRFRPQRRLCEEAWRVAGV